MKKKNNKIKKIIIKIAILICFLGALFFAVGIILNLREYKKAQDSYQSLAKAKSYNEQQTTESLLLTKEEIDELKSINSKFYAWIICEGTNIAYPIVQGDDNEYYLTHLFTNEINNAGCLFIDYREFSDFTNYNTVVYGHNMKDETMFSILSEYKNQEYYENHKEMIIQTEQKNYKLELFSAYTVPDEFDAWKIDFQTTEEFKTWLEQAKQLSDFQTELTPSEEDRIVTLSTCAYDRKNSRYVVMGRLIEI